MTARWPSSSYIAKRLYLVDTNLRRTRQKPHTRKYGPHGTMSETKGRQSRGHSNEWHVQHLGCTQQHLATTIERVNSDSANLTEGKRNRGVEKEQDSNPDMVSVAPAAIFETSRNLFQVVCLLSHRSPTAAIRTYYALGSAVRKGNS